MFLMLDRPDADEDSRLADHVLHVHRFGQSPALLRSVVSPEVLRYVIYTIDLFNAFSDSISLMLVNLILAFHLL